MGTFVYFTDERKRQANDVDLEAYLLRRRSCSPLDGKNAWRQIVASRSAATSGSTMRHRPVGIRLTFSASTTTCPFRRRCGN